MRKEAEQPAEWEIPGEHARRILEALGAPNDNQALANVTFALRTYLALWEREQRAPRKREVAKRLHAVAAAAASLRAALEEGKATPIREAAAKLREALRVRDYADHEASRVLTRQAKSALEVPVALREALIDKSHRRRDLLAAIREIEKRAFAYQPRGRPRESAQGILVNLLALEWERVNGKFPGRVNWKSTTPESGRFTAFVDEALCSLTPTPTIFHAEIKRVIAGRKEILARK